MKAELNLHVEAILAFPFPDEAICADLAMDSEYASRVFYTNVRDELSPMDGDTGAYTISNSWMIRMQ